MLLRASSKATERNVSLSCAIGEPIVTDIKHGELLFKFTEAANSRSPELKTLIEEMRSKAKIFKIIRFFHKFDFFVKKQNIF